LRPEQTMANRKHHDIDAEKASVAPEGVEVDATEGEATPKLTMEVNVESRGACERHVSVTVSREDIDRYFNKEFSELMSSAQVPGFRAGHVPRKLIEQRFRKDVGGKVKSSLLLDSISQVSEQNELAAISEPDFDLDSIVIPNEGPMTYEFDLEVRPEFTVPEWKGLVIDRPVREYSEDEVTKAVANLLARHGKLVPCHEAAQSGDYIACALRFSCEGKDISSAEEELIRIRPTLSFRDGKIEKFDEIMAGVRAGETRVAEAELSPDAPNEAIRGKKITATFEVKEIKKLELPELTPDFLKSMGDFESEADLRDAVRDMLKRQLEYQQSQSARKQITAALMVSADWELPPGLLKRQSERELSRAVLELQRSGFGDDDIQAYENELRRNSQQSTARALKEHFIFERIAEDEKIEDVPEDYDAEIDLIAAQSGETSRRVRARLEKTGRMDILRNQIIERKVVEMILSHAKFKEVPYQPEQSESESLNRAVGGDGSDIPEAKAEGKTEAAGE
jgi:trigger factor